MDRAERRLRRFEQKNRQRGRPRRGRGRGYMVQDSEASNFERHDQPERLECSYCGREKGSTPMFRPGPNGPKSLCNTCGLQWATMGYLGGRENVSEEEGTDGITVYEEENKKSPKDLQAQLHLSDARGLKWQKIAAERLEENKELQTEIECLKFKIEEITESTAVRQGQFESRLRAEIQSLKERNDELIKILDKVTHHSSGMVSEMEKMMQILQNAKSNTQNTHYQASQGAGNAGKHVHENIAELNVCNGNQSNGHRESSKQTGNFERNGCESAAEVHVDAEQRNRVYPERNQHLGGNGCKFAQQTHVDGSDNCDLKTDKFVHLEKRVHDSNANVTIDIGGQSSEDAAGLPSGLQQAASIGNDRPEGIPSEDESEVLITAAERRSALALVNKEFLMWLNSRIRRPTPEEMSCHKSQFMRRPRSPGEEVFYWTGIGGSLLLDRFHADTGMEKPSCNALTTLLRSVLHIEGSQRADDMLWCLVWADCLNPTQLPGYLKHPHDAKRARVADDEVVLRFSKVNHS